MASSLTFKDGLVVGFAPKFRSFDDDWERYMFAVVDLERAGAIQRRPGIPLVESHCGPGHDWLIDVYFETGRLDLLEAGFTPTGEASFGPIYEGVRTKIIDRFLAMGETERALRIWRAHLGLLRGVFWFYIKERRIGHVPDPKRDPAYEAQRRRSHEEFVASIPDKKRILLELLREYRNLVVAIGGARSEVDRVDADIAAVTAENRPKPAGRTDARKMDEDILWELLDADLHTATLGERLDSLPHRLALFRPSAIRAFDKMLGELEGRAYRTDVWALAHLLAGGCSDDSFEEFRGWLILQGRAVFESTLADPDGFDVALFQGDASGMERLRSVAPLAYDLREGKTMPKSKLRRPRLGGPQLEEDQFALALPRIASATIG